MSQSSSFQRYNFSPSIPKDEIGISISIRIQSKDKLIPNTQLFGSFRVPKKYAISIDGNLHKAIVIVATSGEYVFVNNIFEDAIIFEDDLIHEGELIQGFFNIQLFDFIKYYHGDYNIMASLGSYSSNIEVTSL